MALPDVLLSVGGLTGLSASVWAANRCIQKHLSIHAEIHFEFVCGPRARHVDEHKAKLYHRRRRCLPRRAR
jgi:hypothetical protein